MTFLKFFHPDNWSRYSRRFADNKEVYYKYKRVILLSQFTLLGSVIGVLHAVEDLIDGLLFLPLMDGIMAFFVFMCYLVNERGYHKSARYFLLTFLNVFFFVYSSIAPRELGIYFYYFTWIGLASIIFEPEEDVQRISFVVISTFLLVLLFTTEFRMFGDITVSIQNAERSMLINLVTSITVLVFFIVYMARMNDITEKRLTDLAREVKIKNEDLQKTNAELDRFLYSTSHDLRAPLMSVKGLINLIELEGNRDPKYFAMVNERLNKLDGFIRDIIDYARNGRTQLIPETIKLHQFLTEIIEGIRYMEGADQVKINLNVDEQLTLVADKSRLYMILNNLVSNAIKYRHPSGNSWIKISAKSAPKQLRLDVSDNGRGIEPEHIERIFDMFYRATDTSKGSGLGLYITKQAVQRLGGSITVHSVYDKGTTFTVTLPHLAPVA